MPTEISKWLAHDGREFPTQQEADAHESYLAMCAEGGKFVRSSTALNSLSPAYAVLADLFRHGVIELGENARATKLCQQEK